MKTLRMWWAVLAMGLGMSAPAQVYTNALGIGLEGVRYPYPVMFLPTQVGSEFVRIAHMDVNQSGNPVVVLLHGKNFYGAYWAGTIDALVRQGCRVIVPDQLGFGKSSKPDIK